MEHENGVLHDKVEHLEEQVEVIKVYESKIDCLVRQLRDKDRLIETKERACVDKQHQIDDIQIQAKAESDGLKMRINTLEAQLEEVKTENAGLSEEVRRLQKTLCES